MFLGYKNVFHMFFAPFYRMLHFPPRSSDAKQRNSYGPPYHQKLGLIRPTLLNLHLTLLRRSGRCRTANRSRRTSNRSRPGPPKRMDLNVHIFRQLLNKLLVHFFFLFKFIHEHLIVQLLFIFRSTFVSTRVQLRINVNVHILQDGQDSQHRRAQICTGRLGLQGHHRVRLIKINEQVKLNGRRARMTNSGQLSITNSLTRNITLRQIGNGPHLTICTMLRTRIYHIMRSIAVNMKNVLRRMTASLRILTRISLRPHYPLLHHVNEIRNIRFPRKRWTIVHLVNVLVTSTNVGLQRIRKRIVRLTSNRKFGVLDRVHQGILNKVTMTMRITNTVLTNVRNNSGTVARTRDTRLVRTSARHLRLQDQVNNLYRTGVATANVQNVGRLHSAKVLSRTNTMIKCVQRVGRIFAMPVRRAIIIAITLAFNVNNNMATQIPVTSPHRLQPVKRSENRNIGKKNANLHVRTGPIKNTTKRLKRTRELAKARGNFMENERSTTRLARHAKDFKVRNGKVNVSVLRTQVVNRGITRVTKEVNRRRTLRTDVCRRLRHLLMRANGNVVTLLNTTTRNVILVLRPKAPSVHVSARLLRLNRTFGRAHLVLRPRNMNLRITIKINLIRLPGHVNKIAIKMRIQLILHDLLHARIAKDQIEICRSGNALIVIFLVRNIRFIGVNRKRNLIVVHRLHNIPLRRKDNRVRTVAYQMRTKMGAGFIGRLVLNTFINRRIRLATRRLDAITSSLRVNWRILDLLYNVKIRQLRRFTNLRLVRHNFTNPAVQNHATKRVPRERDQYHRDTRRRRRHRDRKWYNFEGHLRG